MVKQEYNDEPVCYCKRCFSLRIKTLPETKSIRGEVQKPTPYCESCGSASIGETHIDDWEKKYENYHGSPHITRN